VVKAGFAHLCDPVAVRRNSINSYTVPLPFSK